MTLFLVTLGLVIAICIAHLAVFLVQRHIHSERLQRAVILAVVLPATFALGGYMAS